MQTAVTGATPEVITFDGKTFQQSSDQRKGQRPLHLVSAWANTRHLVHAHEAVVTKENEVTTLPTRLDLTGQIVEGGGD